MRNHYIPEYYLKGFTESPDSNMIWFYDQDHLTGTRTGIHNVANENRLYSDGTEAYITREIEEPAKEIIQKIRAMNPITPEEKRLMAIYMMMIWKRTPRHKVMMNEMAPALLEPIKEELYKKLEDEYEAYPGKKEIYLKRKNEFDVFFSDENKIQALLNQVWQDSLKPDKVFFSINAMASMTWIFWVSKEEAFITNDNPLFFFSKIGIGNLKSEICFPISTQVTIWGAWRNDLREGVYAIANRQIVRELHRRTISNRTKYVYSSKQLEWITTLMGKKNRLLYIT